MARPLRSIPERDYARFPVDPWRMVESRYSADDLGETETLFAIANGYFGMRANPPEGRVAHRHGTFVNGFHETWPIVYPETAYGLASTGQTIINAPDTKLMKLYVEDEPLLVSSGNIDDYERSIDFRTGLLSRNLIWTTPAGHRIAVRSTSMASMRHRHLGVMTLQLELLDSDASITISSQVQNRQDGVDEYGVASAALGEGDDPRQARSFSGRILEPEHQVHDPEIGDGGAVVLGFRAASSRMTVAAGYTHAVNTPCGFTADTEMSEDHAVTTINIEGQTRAPIHITKFVSYHSSKGVPTPELARRCQRTLSRAHDNGVDAAHDEHAERISVFWKHADAEVVGQPELQQAIRWNLWQLAQATIGADSDGVPAKGLTADGYDGQYFWDSEMYVAPFLAYTNPVAAKNLIRLRYDMLDSAYARAEELGHPGALFAWRTINGEEASAYYPAGTAQYHLGAAIAYAIGAIHSATADMSFIESIGAEILVGIARLFEDLGFYKVIDESFHIHGVTGPDEYSAIVNDNLYTNVMARYTLRLAADVVDQLEAESDGAIAELERLVGLRSEEPEQWRAAADAMHLPFDEGRQIHLQDEAFLSREPWDFDGTPAEMYPLLLHFHPLNIYRKQVLKQPDVVLAMALQPHEFSEEQRRRNFEFYDPLTTGDSSLSTAVQALAAAQIGELELAKHYLREAAFIDVMNTHNNTSDGVHVANAGGVWSSLVSGFGGFADRGEYVEFTPRIPAGWEALKFAVTVRGTCLEVTATSQELTVSVVSGEPVDVEVHGQLHTVSGIETFTLT